MIHISPLTVLLVMFGLLFVGALVWLYDVGLLTREDDDAE